MLHTIFNFLSFYGFHVAMAIGVIGGIAGHVHWKREHARIARMQKNGFAAAARREQKRLERMGL